MFFFASSEEKKLRQDVKNQLEICLRSFEDKNQDKYKKAMEFISKYVQNNNQQIIEIVIDSIKATIKDEQLPPVRKYQSIRLLRDLMKIEIKNKNKALGKYVLKKIFKRLTVLASHNAGSNEEDKGKDIFKNVKKDQEKYSILFLNELLLAIQEWAKTWPGVSDGMKKQFNEPYKQLLTNGVKFPKEILKAPQPQGYRGDQSNRNSQSPYQSVPAKRQSVGKNDQRSISQIRSSSIEQKPVKKSPSAIKVTSGKLDDKKVKKYFNNIMPPIEYFLNLINQIQNPDDPQNLSMLIDMIEGLRTVVAEGNSFCTQLEEEQMKTDPMGKIILSALSYSQKASQDIKKVLKNGSQFDRFKNKYLKLGNQLFQSIKNSLNPPIEEKPAIIQQPKPIKKVETSVPKITQVQKVQQKSSKKLSIPRVSAQNPYNSSSGPGNNWVIKERSQYNSNSHRDQQDPNQKFGSFGIGGIGQKVRNQSSKQKQKSAFANKSQTERPQKKNVQPQIKELQNKKPKTLKDIGSNKQVAQQSEKQKNKETTFGSFKVSDENSKPQSSQNDMKAKNKKVEEVKDDFNDSGFQEQHKAQFQREQKDINQSGGFFGDFDQPNPNAQLPKARIEIRKKTNNLTAKEIHENQQNPFQNPFNSKIGSDSNNFSAFNHEKPSAFGSQSQVQNQRSTSLAKGQPQSKRKQSFNDPFQNNSFDLNKSNLSKEQRNSFDDKNPNFWQNEADKSNSDNRSQQNRSQIQNPFQTQQLSRRNQKSVNPFEEDNKSELSQKNKSSIVVNFEMNQSFTKSEKQNPFGDPSQTTSNNLNRTNEQATNPFEQTSKDDFRPKPTQKFQSVSQQGSFKKVDIKQTKFNKNSQIDNPFDAMTEHRSIDEARNQQRMNESIKFSVKGNDQNQGFDFDQFENIPKAQRESINTSSFANPKVKTEPNDFAHSGVFGNERNSLERAGFVQRQRAVNFSQFGEPGEDTRRSKEFEKKEQSKKSINLSDFGDFNDKKSTSKNDFTGFQDFKNAQVKEKNNLDAFEVGKTSGNDFFRQTQQSQINQKPDDVKSKHSGYSAFNINGNNKSERKDKSSVDWNDFENNFEKGRETDKIKFDDDEFKGFGSEMKLSKGSQRPESQMNTDRSQDESKTQTKFYNREDLKLQFSQNNSKYQSPEFNQKYDSVSMNQQQQKDIMSSLRQVQEVKIQQQQHRPSIQFEEFAPVEKRGYEWNPMGIRPEKQLSRMFSCTDNELQAKKIELEQIRMIYNEQKMMIQKAKELYNQARKVYLQKVSKIDMILKQKQSYKMMLVSLSEANHNKESEIFALNEKIKEASGAKEKILEKEKLFFEYTKSNKEIEVGGPNYRPNHNKWEIFNRNLKMMRQKEMEEGVNKYQSVNNYSRNGYVNSRYY